MLRRFSRQYSLILLVAPFVMLARALAPGQALFWGTPVMQFVPWRDWAWETLQAGYLPLWNPLAGMGAPLVANYQSGLFYPPNWSYFLLAALGGTPAHAWWQGWMVAIHLTWAAFGMAFLARRLGLGALAQTISGLSYGMSGYLVARSGFLSINAAAAWVPWVILGVSELVLSRPAIHHRAEEDQGRSRLRIFLESILSPRAILLLALPWGVQLLAGHAQTAWYTLLLAGMWAGFLAARGFRNWMPLAVAAAWGGLLATVQLLPTAEYLMQSQRAASVEFEFAMTYSFWPWRFLGLLAPGLFGSPVSGDYWGYANFWEDAVYIGLLPFLLAVAAILRAAAGWRKARTSGENRRVAAIPSQADFLARSPALVFFLSGLILLSFLLALGKNTPLFPWLYRHVPTFAMFQAPTRFTLWAIFALALLAGIGAESWRRPAGLALYWSRLGVAAALAVGIGAGGASLATRYFPAEIEPSVIRVTALAGFWGLGAGLLALTAPSSPVAEKDRTNRGWWGWGAVLLVAFDLVVAGWGLNPAIDAGLYGEEAPTAGQVRAMLGEDGRLYLPPEDEEQLKFKRFFNFETFSPEGGWGALRASLLPDLHMLDGIPSANNFDPLLPGRYARWMEELNVAQPEVEDRMLNLMAVKVVEKLDLSQPSGVRFEARPALPRVRWVACGQAARDEADALDRLLRGAFDVEKEAILEAPEASPIPNCFLEDGLNYHLEKISESPDRLEVSVQAPVAGYLILADVWYPGWNARVDGSPVSILRANYLFRAVQVPAGEHRVTFVYRPASFYFGAGISWLVWLGLAAILFHRARLRQPGFTLQSSHS